MIMYYRVFFRCKDCGFILTTLSQATSEINCCPSCESGDIDYATKGDRENYVADLTEELRYMQESGE